VCSRPTAPPYFYLFCPHSAFFAMSDSRSFNEEGLLKRDDDTGEHIGVHIACINTNHLFQMPTGPGRMRTGKGGKNFKRTTRTNNSATIGTENPSTPSPPASSPAWYRSGRRAAKPSCLLALRADLETRLLSPGRTKPRSSAYYVSARRISEATEERCSLGNLVSVRFRDRISTLCDNLPAHPFSRKNNFPELCARAADCSSPGCTHVQQPSSLPFLPGPSILSTAAVWLLQSS
jgi:hypothetical protein